MPKQEEVVAVLRKIHENRPGHTFDKVNDHDAGTMGAIKFLYESQGPVKSKDISDDLGISTARMAVLLKKLEAKGLVEKSSAPGDGRVTLIQLTPKGRDFAQKAYSNLCRMIENLIDEFGIDYLMRLLEDMAKIKSIMMGNYKTFEETFHD